MGIHAVLTGRYFKKLIGSQHRFSTINGPSFEMYLSPGLRRGFEICVIQCPMSMPSSDVHVVIRCPCRHPMSMSSSDVHVVILCPCHTTFMASSHAHIVIRCPCRHPMSMPSSDVHVVIRCPCRHPMSMSSSDIHVVIRYPCRHPMFMSSFDVHVVIHRHHPISMSSSDVHVTAGLVLRQFAHAPSAQRRHVWRARRRWSGAKGRARGGGGRHVIRSAHRRPDRRRPPTEQDRKGFGQQRNDAADHDARLNVELLTWSLVVQGQQRGGRIGEDIFE